MYSTRAFLLFVAGFAQIAVVILVCLIFTSTGLYYVCIWPVLLRLWHFAILNLYMVESCPLLRHWVHCTMVLFFGCLHFFKATAFTSQEFCFLVDLISHAGVDSIP